MKEKLKGDNGIVTKAKLGKQNMEKAQEQEKTSLLEVANEMDYHIASSSRSHPTRTILFEGHASSGDITFLDGHTIDEFDSIRFIYGIHSGDNSWDCIQNSEYDAFSWNYAIEHASPKEATIGLYGHSANFIDLFNLTKTGFSISGTAQYSIAMIYGINY